MGGVYFVKKRGKWGVAKKWTFPQRSVHMYRVHYVQCQYFFLFYILIIWGGGCVRIQLTPCLRACHREDITTGNPPKCPFPRRGGSGLPLYCSLGPHFSVSNASLRISAFYAEMFFSRSSVALP